MSVKASAHDGSWPVAPGRRRPSDGSRRASLSALVRTARPRQWSKNVLVLAAPAAGGVLDVPAVAAAAGWASLVFLVASASTYLINDAADAEADRNHPVKASRPVAAGLVSAETARRTGLALAALAVLLAALLNWPLAGVAALYLAVTWAYSKWLKHYAIVDLLAVAGCFVLRAVAGGAATGIVLSNWFLLVVLFGSLFLVTAKRSAEVRLSSAAGAARATLASYPRSWLDQVVTLSMAGVVITYATWALQYVGTDVASLPLALSVVPFLALVLRYSLLVAGGAGEAPEEILISDRFLLIAGVSWTALVGGALYLA